MNRWTDEQRMRTLRFRPLDLRCLRAAIVARTARCEESTASRMRSWWTTEPAMSTRDGRSRTVGCRDRRLRGSYRCLEGGGMGAVRWEIDGEAGSAVVSSGLAEPLDGGHGKGKRRVWGDRPPITRQATGFTRTSPSRVLLLANSITLAFLVWKWVHIVSYLSWNCWIHIWINPVSCLNPLLPPSNLCFCQALRCLLSFIFLFRVLNVGAEGWLIVYSNTNPVYPKVELFVSCNPLWPWMW